MIVTRGLGRGVYLGAIVALGLALYPSGDTGTAQGKLLAAQISFLTGSPQATSSVSGQTLTDTVSLFDGAATGGSGGGTDGSYPGDTLSDTGSLITGSVQADSSVTGLTFSQTASFLDGAASAAAVQAGASLQATVTLLDGAASATGAGEAAGQTLTDTASLLSGNATATSTITGASLSVSVALFDGSVNITGDGDAAGHVYTQAVSLIAGSCTADSMWPGQVYTVTIRFLPTDVFTPAFNPDEVYDRTSQAAVLWSDVQSHVRYYTSVVALYDQVPHTTVYSSDRTTALNQTGESAVFDVQNRTELIDRDLQTTVYDVVQMNAMISQEDQ